MDRYLAAHMAHQVGNHFDARVSGVTRFGLFVTLESNGASGIVPLASLPDDRWTEDEAGRALVGRRTGLRFTLGQAVEARLAEADPRTGSLVFHLLGGASPHPPPAPVPARPRPRRGSPALLILLFLLGAAWRRGRSRRRPNSRASGWKRCFPSPSARCWSAISRRAAPASLGLWSLRGLEVLEPLLRPELRGGNTLVLSAGAGTAAARLPHPAGSSADGGARSRGAFSRRRPRRVVRVGVAGVAAAAPGGAGADAAQRLRGAFRPPRPLQPLPDAGGGAGGAAPPRRADRARIAARRGPRRPRCRGRRPGAGRRRCRRRHTGRRSGAGGGRGAGLGARSRLRGVAAGRPGRHRGGAPHRAERQAAGGAAASAPSRRRSRSGPRARDGVLSLRVEAFTGGTDEQVARRARHAATSSRAAIRGVVLDLRGNRGGLLSEAVAVAECLPPRRHGGADDRAASGGGAALAGERAGPRRRPADGGAGGRALRVGGGDRGGDARRARPGGGGRQRHHGQGADPGRGALAQRRRVAGDVVAGARARAAGRSRDLACCRRSAPASARRRWRRIWRACGGARPRAAPASPACAPFVRRRCRLSPPAEAADLRASCPAAEGRDADWAVARALLDSADRLRRRAVALKHSA